MTALKSFGRASWIAIAIWVVAFVAYTVFVGLPTKRSNVLLWVVLAIFALGASRPKAMLVSLLRDWSPVILALVTYDLLRGLSDNGNRTAHSAPHFNFDRWIGGGITPTERLQEWFHVDGIVRWYDYAGWGVYTSHFLMPWAVALALWAVASPRFRPYLYGLALLSWMALATYYLYPAKPPWMIGQEGMHSEVSRIVHSVWKEVGIEKATRVFEPVDPRVAGGKSAYSNPVAALPSLHAAFPMFIAIMLWSRRRWANVLLALYPIAMGLTLVYAGEHYIFDVVMGWLYAGIAAWIVIAAFARWGHRPGEPDLAETMHLHPNPVHHASGVGDTVSVE